MLCYAMLYIIMDLPPHRERMERKRNSHACMSTRASCWRHTSSPMIGPSAWRSLLRLTHDDRPPRGERMHRLGRRPAFGMM